VINRAIDAARRIFGRITSYMVYRVALSMDIMFLVVLSTLVVSVILISRRFLPRVPVSMFMVVAGIAASFYYDFAGYSIAIIGPVPGGLPTLSMPRVDWHELRVLLLIAMSCFVIIIAQSAATARVFAIRPRERVDENVDILGLSAVRGGVHESQ